MASGIHGTKVDPSKLHPVLDLKFWEEKFPLGNFRRTPGCISSPRDIAFLEQARSLARARGDLGRAVPCDMFVWSASRLHDRPWLTKIGGLPWRARTKPWPTHNGNPLTFVGQICFADSVDFLPWKLPDEVLLIFMKSFGNGIDTSGGTAFEWSPRFIGERTKHSDVPPHCQFPIEYQGVIHRSVQYVDRHACDPKFLAAGFDSAWRWAAAQATSIGTHCDLPQGWPFVAGDGNTLIATLSSMYCSGPWPLCDVPSPLICVNADGSDRYTDLNSALHLEIGDAGAVWLSRDRHERFDLSAACS